MDRDDGAGPLSLGSDEQRSETNTSPNCNICEPDIIEPAIGFCKDCLHHLCDECFKCHHRASKENKSHRLIGKSDMPKKSISVELKNVKCFECYSDEPNVVCETHDKKLLCLNCTSSDLHDKCKWTPIKQKLNKLDICKTLKEFEDRLTSVANTCIYEKRQTDEILNKANKSKNDTLLAVAEQIDLLETHLNELRNIKNKLCDQAKKDTEKLKHINSGNAKTLLKIQKMREDIETMKDNEYRAFLALHVAEPNLKEMEAKRKQENLERPAPEYRFVPNTLFKNMLVNVKVSGKLTMSTSKKPEPPCPSDGSYVEYGLPRSVALNDNSLVVIDKLHNSIQVLDSTLLLSSYPWDLAVYQDNKIAVTHPKERKIAFYEVKGGNIKVVEDLHLDCQCEGISCFENSLFVTSTDPKGVTVVERTLQGKFDTRMIPVDNIMQPSYIDVCKDKICVSDRQTNKVLLMDWNGNRTKIFQIENMQMPLTVAFFREAIVVLGFRSNTLHRIRPEEQETETRFLQNVSVEEVLTNEQFKSSAFWQNFGSSFVLFVCKHT